MFGYSFFGLDPILLGNGLYNEYMFLVRFCGSTRNKADDVPISVKMITKV
jgi:hypothetical protein